MKESHVAMGGPVNAFGSFSLSKLRDEMAKYRNEGGKIYSPGRRVEGPVMQKMLINAGLPDKRASEYVSQYLSRDADVNKGLVKFDSFFREYVRMQCFKAVTAAKLASKRGLFPSRDGKEASGTTRNLEAKREPSKNEDADEQSGSRKIDKETAKPQHFARSQVVGWFSQYFAKEDASEITSSIYRFLKKQENSKLTADHLHDWYSRAYSGKGSRKETKARVHQISKEAKIQGWTRWMDKYTKIGTVTVVIKGTRSNPKCGFSLDVILALSRIGVDFEVFNIQKTQADFQEFWKKRAKWPTFPQVWVNGTLFGGCDVVEELEDDGELKQSLQALGAKLVPALDEKLIESLAKRQEKAREYRSVSKNKKGHCAEATGEGSECDSKVDLAKKCAEDFGDLEPVDRAIVEVMAATGDDDEWTEKVKILRAKHPGLFKAPESTWNENTLSSRWKALRPRIKAQMKKGEKMPCGKSCSECETRPSCHLHDIEDLI
mmetsp:Transcript_18060/g.28775  ORF Transcript_18060/g.28775 Transcript_18060/m.28775 type:complete len:490 (-) Transcript_18060:62-1531(-)